MGPAGQVIIFMLLLVAQVIILVYLVGFASHCFLVVIEGTASGNDRVMWPDEPIFDWLWKPVYLIWLVGFWLAPAWIFLKIRKYPALVDEPLLQFLAAAVPVVWLLLPIGLMSSMSSATRWAFLSPRALGRMLRCPGTVIAYYLSSGLVLGGMSALLYPALFRKQWLLIPVAGLVAAAAFLIYARLLGRLGWVLSQLEVPDAPEVPKAQPTSRLPSRPPSRPAEDPWAVPPVEDLNDRIRREGPVGTNPLGEAVESYLLRDEEEERKAARKEARKAARKREAERESYGMREEALPEQPSVLPDDEPVAKRPERKKRRGKEAALEPEPPVRSRRPDILERLEEENAPDPPPAVPMLSGVYSFPWYDTSVGAWLKLAFGLTVLGFLYVAQQQFAFHGGPGE